MFRSGIYTIEEFVLLQSNVENWYDDTYKFLLQINLNRIKIDYTMANNSYRG